MKKHALRILGLVLALGLVMQLGVYAFGGTYPQHSTAASGFNGEQSTHEDWTSSDEAYLFQVGGKKFVLLDTDSEGNYFVMAEESYGKRAYTTSTNYEKSPVLETKTVTGEGEEQTITFTPAELNMDDGWRFSTTESDSIGYWLNHEFLTNGNGSKALPKEITDNLVEKEWAVEGTKTIADWTGSHADYYNGAESVAKYRAEYTKDNGYTVTGKLSLLSYTEYKKYQNIIGWEYQDVNWDGFMLRTPAAWLTSPSPYTSLKYSWGSVQVKCNRTKDAALTAPGQKLVLACNDTPLSPNFHVRPVMWLDKDFFKKVPCDVHSLGAVPKEEIVRYSDTELSLIYSDGELSVLRDVKRGWDWGHYPQHSSDFKTLVRIGSAVSDVKKGASPEENLFTIGGRRFILLDRDGVGNYFVMADETLGHHAPLLDSYVNGLPEEYKTNGQKDTKKWTPEIWRLNPAVTLTDSLAGRLNHTTWGILAGTTERGTFAYNGAFNGDKEKKTMPREIIDNLLEYDWEIEPTYLDYSWTCDGVEYPQWAGDDNIGDTAKAEITAYRDNVIKKNSAKETVRAKVMPISYTEYETYKSKIGLQYFVPGNEWIGTVLRTQLSWVTSSSETAWSASPSYLEILVSASNDNLKYEAASTSPQYAVQPVMWLKKDFFKNNHIDVDTAGATVFAEMKDLYTAEDLAGTYTEAEIEKIGIRKPLSHVTFKSNGENVSDIGSVTTLTVSADVSKNGEETAAVMIFAIYDSNNNLLAADCSTVDFSNADTQNKEITLSGFSGAADCKVMLWSKADGITMEPLCNYESFLPQS